MNWIGFAAILLMPMVASAQYINLRDLNQDTAKLKLCLARTPSSSIPDDIEINNKYVDLVRQSNPDATFVFAHGLAECHLREGTGRYETDSTSGEGMWSWRYVTPPRFPQGYSSPEGNRILSRTCEDAVVAQVGRPNFDHSVHFPPVEVPREGLRYTPQQEANLARSWGRISDRGMPVKPWDIEVSGTAFYKSPGTDLLAIRYMCLLDPMLHLKGVRTK
jgi:hypothetical protein